MSARVELDGNGDLSIRSSDTVFVTGFRVRLGRGEAASDGEALRREHPALRTGSLVPVSAADGLVVFRRELAGERILVALNADRQHAASVPLGNRGRSADAFSDEPLTATLVVPPLDARVAIERTP